MPLIKALVPKLWLQLHVHVYVIVHIGSIVSICLIFSRVYVPHCMAERPKLNCNSFLGSFLFNTIDSLLKEGLQHLQV